MPSAKSTFKCRIGLTSFALILFTQLSAQSNSPYSRYGLGDMTPNTNLVSRGMGGISAGYADWYSVNFANPASFASFLAIKSQRSNKLESGLTVLDVGVNLENRTLIQPGTNNKFTSSDPYISYFQFGVPLRKNWGLAIGLRPVTRIGYRIDRGERITDPDTGAPLDSVITLFNGSGGAFLPTIGTGFSIKNLSLGINMGYLFGRRDLTTNRVFINDTVNYYAADYTTNYSFGSLFFTAGAQYRIPLKQRRYIRLGFAGNWEQNVKGSRDMLRQTYSVGPGGETIQIDSVFQTKDVKGNLTYPASYTAGFVFGSDSTGFLFGVDYSATSWSKFKFFDNADPLQDNWKLMAGGQYRPKPGSNYFSNVAYRAGISIGEDYIKLNEALPLLGLNFGLSLPIRRTFRRDFNYRINTVNLGFELMKRGNDQQPLKENMFRLSVGFSFTDYWFLKPKYD